MVSISHSARQWTCEILSKNECGSHRLMRPDSIPFVKMQASTTEAEADVTVARTALSAVAGEKEPNNTADRCATAQQRWRCAIYEGAWKCVESPFFILKDVVPLKMVAIQALINQMYMKNKHACLIRAFGMFWLQALLHEGFHQSRILILHVHSLAPVFLLHLRVARKSDACFASLSQ